MAGFEKTAKTSRAGRFPPPRRGPGRHSRLGLLTALDAARRPPPPRPQRGPRCRRRPSPPPVPRPTPVPPRLGVFNHRPPPWFCGANQETRLPSPLAPSIQEWTPQLLPGPSSGPSCPSPPSTARSIGHSTSTVALRRHLMPVYLQSKDQAHDHTARLTIHSSQSRIEYSTFLKTNAIKRLLPDWIAYTYLTLADSVLCVCVCFVSLRCMPL